MIWIRAGQRADHVSEHPGGLAGIERLWLEGWRRPNARSWLVSLAARSAVSEIAAT